MKDSTNSLISVIVPVYNVEKYLERCVDSLLAQTYKNLEIILVDDGSTDRSGEICDKYRLCDDRIIVVHKENGGLSSARNAGLEIASGEYIGFIDSDDWVDKKMYEVLLQNLVIHNADISDVDSITIDHYGFIENKEERIDVKDGQNMLKDYFILDKYSVCRKLYKKEVIGSDRFPIGKINEDICTNYKFLKNASRIVKSSLIMYYYFTNPNSITGTMFKEKDFDLLDACKELVNETKSNEALRRLAEIKLAISYYSLLGRYIMYPHTEFIDLDSKVNYLHKQLRNNYFRILTSHIRLKKKCMITVVTMFKPQFLKKIVDMIKR